MSSPTHMLPYQRVKSPNFAEPICESSVPSFLRRQVHWRTPEKLQIPEPPKHTELSSTSKERHFIWVGAHQGLMRMWEDEDQPNWCFLIAVAGWVLSVYLLTRGF